MATKEFGLGDLKKIGGVLTGKPVARTITWATEDDEGKAKEHTFTVGIVKLGVAATERIYGAGEDKSRWALMIHESVRLGKGFEERIPYENACNLVPSLFAVLAQEAAKVNPRQEIDEGND